MNEYVRGTKYTANEIIDFINSVNTKEKHRIARKWIYKNVHMKDDYEYFMLLLLKKWDFPITEETRRNYGIQQIRNKTATI